MQFWIQGLKRPFLSTGATDSPMKAEKAGRKIAYGGKTFYFDTDECKQQFEREPKRYIKKTSEGTSAEEAPSPKAPKKTHGHEH